MKLADRHHNELMSRLDQVWLVGYASITHAELKYWYDRERVTAAIWKDIRSKWHDLAEERGYVDEDELPWVPQIKVGINEEDYVLIWAEEDWLIDFSKLTGAAPETNVEVEEVEEVEEDVLAAEDESGDVEKPSEQGASESTRILAGVRRVRG